MRRRLTAPLVLFDLLLGLAGGPHPCHATEARRVMPPMPHCQSMPGMPGMSKAAPASPGSTVLHGTARGCCGLPGSSPGDAAQCEQTCSLLAVLYRAPVLSPSGTAYALPVPNRELRLSLFTPTIDHIPL